MKTKDMKKSNYNVSKLVIIVVFLLVIYAPPIKMISTPSRGWSVTEKRSLASIPVFPTSIKEAKAFPSQFEKYYNDNFGYREKLIRRYNREMQKRFGKTAVSTIMNGQNGWYYYSVNSTIEDYQGLDLFSQKQLESIKVGLEAKSKALNDIGVKYIFLVPPNKQTIYPEHLPDHFKNVKGQTRFEQLMGYMDENSTFKIMDLRKPLMETKKDYPVYFKTDTHWNDDGGFVAYKVIMHQLREFFPKENLLPIDGSVVNVYESKDEAGDLSNMIDFLGEIREPHRVLKVKTQCSEETKSLNDLDGFKMMGDGKEELVITVCEEKSLRAVIIRDSFGAALKPFISEHFKEIYFFSRTGQYNRAKITNIVDVLKPDVLIEEIVERELKNKIEQYL